jgi:hypothetical protein
VSRRKFLDINKDRLKILERYGQQVRVGYRRDADGAYHRVYECQFHGHQHAEVIQACVCLLMRDPKIERVTGNLFLVKE